MAGFAGAAHEFGQGQLTIEFSGDNTLRVNPQASGSGTGSTFDDGITSLQAALALAQPGDQVWVMQGTHVPTPPGGLLARGGDPREATFALPDGVELYGGFDGSEELLEDRDIAGNETILSCDLSGDDESGGDNSENCYHVVTIVAPLETGRVDGFTIERGNANLGVDSHDWGGGMKIRAGTPIIVNCTFQDNYGVLGGGIHAFIPATPEIRRSVFRGNSAGIQGGGIFLNNVPAVISRCMFQGNSAPNGAGVSLAGSPSQTVITNSVFVGNSGSDGGGIANNVSSPRITNCLLNANSATSGGGVWNYGASDPVIANSTFYRNTATAFGGGIHVVNNPGTGPIVVNTLLWQNTAGGSNDEAGQLETDGSSVTVNYSLVQGWTGGYGGAGNSGATPSFYDPNGADDTAGNEDDDLSLVGSNGIDAGDDASVPPDAADLDDDGDTSEDTPIDLNENPRFVGASVDIGASEAPAGPLVPAVSEWGVLVIALVTLLAGTLVLRARRSMETETA